MGVSFQMHPAQSEGVARTAQRPLPPAFLLRAGVRIRALLHRAIDKLVPAEVLVFERATALIVAHALGSVARARVADALDSQPRSADELASELSLDADALHRTLRLLASAGIFELRSDGRFAHNRRSRTLRSGHPSRARDAADYFSSEPNAGAYLKFDGWLRSGRSAYQALHGMNVFQRFAEHPDEGAIFDQLMMGITLVHARQVARLYPFGEVMRICDLGGGRGALLSELLLTYSHLTGVLYDAQSVVDSARSLLEHRGVVERVERVAGSFFESVPVGADAYLLKNVLHDWDDATCVELLRRVKQVLPAAGRVLVAEALLPANSVDPYGATADVHMGVVCTGRERSREEFARLFEAAGLSLGRVFDGVTIAVVEARHRV